MADVKRYMLIACEILYREVCYSVALSKNIVDIRFMEKGLHDIGAKSMSQKLQEEIDKVDKNRYDAILLVYGLCNNGTVGLRASLPMVIPKAHDCITLLLGSKEKYMEYHDKNSAAYYRSTGWIERDAEKDCPEESIPSQLGINKTYLDYVEQYGEENARYLMETIGDWTANYDKYAYIDVGIGDFERYAEETRRMAGEKGWSFEQVQGSTSLLAKLCDGQWDENDFLVVPPGKEIVASFDKNVLCSGE